MRGTWGTHLQWLCSLLPAPGPPAGTKLIITYHPAYLLRDPRQKKEAWADLQIAMHELGLKPSAKG
jgi:uracil-DNA glycosylase